MQDTLTTSRYADDEQTTDHNERTRRSGWGDAARHGRICEITLGGIEDSEIVDHPQRGEMNVCQMHARRIRGLQRGRFIRADQEATQ